jgi:hypothetical protein
MTRHPKLQVNRPLSHQGRYSPNFTKSVNYRKRVISISLRKVVFLECGGVWGIRRENTVPHVVE